MDIHKATQRYEAWLGATLPLVVEADLDFKHEQMAAAAFPFFRATFYRWAERFVDLCPHLVSTPLVLGVGDLHVENYGTWRDAEGRLVWGINDFDEATHLPYPADLVRLATSAGLAADAHDLSARLKDAVDAILSGYAEGLAVPFPVPAGTGGQKQSPAGTGGHEQSPEAGHQWRSGEPFVLAEHHSQLRRMATGELRDPVRFWAKMQALPDVAADTCPPDAALHVLAALPGPGIDACLHSRRAGLGSLGRPRLVALGLWDGGNVAREVKALVPSAWDWVAGTEEPAIHYGEIIERARRCPDPFTAIRDRWLIRRLAPDCARILLADLPAERDETLLLHAMGAELANVHLGTPGAGPEILADLGVRHPAWLASAAERMVADTEADWTAWRS